MYKVEKINKVLIRVVFKTAIQSIKGKKKNICGC